jgi:hypothetical protein
MQDMVGKIFGKWTVVSFHLIDDNGDDKWMCQCVCGRTKVVGGSQLRCNRTQQCTRCASRSKKHKRGNKHTLWKGCGDIHSSLWRRIIGGAKLRELEFSISIEYGWKLYLSQNRKCAITGVPIFFPERVHDAPWSTCSLDRIDNSKGYIEGNVQWVHKTMNCMKQDIHEGTFLEWCRIASTSSNLYYYNYEKGGGI